MKLAQTITIRSTALTAIRDRSGNKIGWYARCLTCHSERRLALDGYEIGANFVLHHTCTGTPKKARSPIHHSKLHSGKTGTTGR